MTVRGEKVRAGNTWTSSRYWSFIRSALRAAHRRWPPRHTILKERPSKIKKVKVLDKKGRHLTYKTNSKHGKKGEKRYKTIKAYQCERCKKWGKIEVNHRIPCGSLRCSEDLPGFVERMFVEKEGYELLCPPCHQEITNEERKR